MKYYAVACCVALSSVASIGMSIGANAAPIGCSAVAGTVSGKPGVKSVTSALQPASGSNVAYCKVSILYGNSANENINIVVGLPLNSTDGGTGGVQGAWNGRTQGLGGGGCSGTLNPSPAVNTGYVGSGTDGGHDGAPADTSCANGLNPDGTFNVTWIDDFFHEGIKQQVLFSKAVATSYYGMKPAYNYWNGCSTGGRQGYQLAQEFGNELEGILANAPAMNWQRFATAQIWGEIAIKDLVGAQDVLNPAISNGQFAYATNAAIAACDGKDGVVDGIIDEPRTCDFSANTPSLICTANGGASTDPNCLTPQKARAIDLIWDGPRHANGNRIWYPQHRGTALQGLSGNPPFGLTPPLLRWNENSTTFDWHTVTMFGAGGTKSYAQLAMDGSTAPFDGPSFSVADEVDTDGNLDTFKAHGGKLLTFVGGNRPTDPAARRDPLLSSDGDPLQHQFKRAGYSKRAKFYERARFLPTVPRPGRRALWRRRRTAAAESVRCARELGRERRGAEHDPGAGWRGSYPHPSALSVSDDGHLQWIGQHRRRDELPLRRQS